MSEAIQPTQLKLTENSQLAIEWSDGRTFYYPFGKLRNACPCASCREKKKAEPEQPTKKMMILSASEAAPLRIVSMRPVGNYAYNIAFSDDHSSGIYSLELLRTLGQEEEHTVRS